MKVAVGSDHRGFEAKQLIKAIVTQQGHSGLFHRAWDEYSGDQDKRNQSCIMS